MFNRFKKNNKGYMLVEIILAFSITFILLYFIMNLVIKMKNTNDDLLVKTLMYTDKTIVSNGIMELAIEKKDEFNCELLKVEGNVVKYGNEVIDVLSEYAVIDNANINCKDSSKLVNKIMVNIPIIVDQLPDENFSVDVDYRYGPNDTTPPKCEFSVDTDGILTAKIWDVGDDGVDASGIESYQWDDDDFIYINDSLYSLMVNHNITKSKHKITVVDNAGNKETCTYIDTSEPKCSLSVKNGTILLASSNDSGTNENEPSGIKSYKWNDNSDTETNTFTERKINGTGTYTLTTNDYAGNSNTCTISVKNASSYCPNSGTPSTGCYYNANVSYSTDGICYCKGIVGTENGAYPVMPGSCGVGINGQAQCKCLSGYLFDSSQYNDCKITGGPYYTCNGFSSSSNKCSESVRFTCSSGYASTGNGYCYK